MPQAPVTFESFHETLRGVYLEVIAKSIADSLQSGLWQSTQLHWLGFTHEQDKFYVSDSFGRLKNSAADVSRPFDYLESYKINDEHFPDLKVGRLHAAFDDLLNADTAINTGEADADELVEVFGEMRTLAALVSLSLLAREIELHPNLTGSIGRDAKFHVNVAADIEAPLWPAKPPLLICDDTVLGAALGALSPEAETQAMFHRIIAEGRQKRPLPLQQLLVR